LDKLTLDLQAQQQVPGGRPFRQVAVIVQFKMVSKMAATVLRPHWKRLNILPITQSNVYRFSNLGAILNCAVTAACRKGNPPGNCCRSSKVSKHIQQPEPVDFSSKNVVFAL